MQNLPRKSILIVDDEISILKSLQRVLRTTDFEVMIANSGEEALELLKQNELDLVLSDFRMPGMTGGELLAEIALLYPQMTNLIISGYTDFNNVLEVLNNGTAYKFLTKPWDNKELVKELDDAYAHNQAMKNERSSLAMSFFLGQQQAFAQRITELSYDNETFNLLYLAIADKVLQHCKERSCTDIINHLKETVEHNLTVSFEVFDIYEDGFIILVLGDLDTHYQKLSELVTHLQNVPFPQDCSLSDLQLQASLAQSNDIDVKANMMMDTLVNSAVNIHQISEFLSLNHQYLMKKQRELMIKTDVEHAIHNNQFYLQAQPKVNVVNGLIESVEVLIRWQHHNLGMLSPAEFIAIAEADGQIKHITKWVIDSAMHHLSRLLRISHEIKTLSLNISARQLLDSQIVNEFAQALAEYKVPAEKLIVEVTETLLIENINIAAKTLHSLKALGLQIAIDDFGVGYSSFAYLTKLPVDILKLDRSLVHDIDTNIDSFKLVKNLVKTCHEMSIKVVAEGVETSSVYAYIKNTGVDYVQGFYFSAPQDLPGIENMLVQQPFRHKV